MKKQLKKIKIKSYKGHFKDAINESFASFGGSSPTQSVQAPNRGKSGQHLTSGHPYNGQTGPTGFDIDQIGAEEELTSRSPDAMPFPMENIFDDITMSVRHLQNVKSQMKVTLENNPLLTTEQTKALTKMFGDVKECLTKMVHIGKTVEIISRH